ncbi:glycyl-tRNA synthetase beta subunit [Orientia tsutsugamushi str. Sido]|nr:glycyl-tRNA synthetase beta subunit [Orientia tsutsugamushi str. Sido]
MHSYSLILELYSDEIPAKMQKKAELAFQEIFTKNFKLANISFNHLKVYIGHAEWLYIQSLAAKN